MVIAALMLGVGVIAELWAVMTAPLGYQDETGFHVEGKSGEAGNDYARVNPS
jgi:hypothetical protein